MTDDIQTIVFRQQESAASIEGHPKLKVIPKSKGPNKLVINGPCEIEGRITFAGSQCEVIFDGYPGPPMDRKTLKIDIVMKGKLCVFHARRGFTSNGCSVLVQGERRRVEFGEDCMLAGGINIRSSDGHAVFSTSTLEVLENDENILIGDHVWLGLNSTVLKGVEIGAGTIVGRAAS